MASLSRGGTSVRPSHQIPKAAIVVDEPKVDSASLLSESVAVRVSSSQQVK